MIIGLNHRIDELERAVQTSSESLHDQVHHRSVVQTLRTKLGEVTRSLKTILEQRATVLINGHYHASVESNSQSRLCYLYYFSTEFFLTGNEETRRPPWFIFP